MLRGRDLSALKVREKKAWVIISQCLGDKKGIPMKIRLQAAEFVLKRLYPEKVMIGGDGENPVRVEVYLPEVEEYGGNGHKAQAASRAADIISQSKRV